MERVVELARHPRCAARFVSSRSSRTISSSCRWTSPHSRTRMNERKLSLHVAPQIRRALALRLLDELPQAEQADEVGALVAEAPVQLVGLLLRLARPLARVLDVERRRHHEHLAEAAELGAGEDHPADARVDREAREALPERRELAVLAERAELLEHAVALGDRLRLRRIEERKVLDVAEPERLHPQDDAGEPGPLDLRDR